ncbi:MAG TPA: ABC transporter ATP-binding protein [Holophaga sp.]|nr:ABC transporter ATP-binding protein [Holophaga sp.]HPS66838.1 ABC transporter ATP-binding protein [Holophaga sp.]
MEAIRGDLLDVSELRVIFHTYRGTIKALNGVELWLNRGERLGVVGESGCGKSVTSLALMQLIQQPGEITGGRIMFDGRDLMTLSEKELDGVRGREMATIFQEPVAALNPVMKAGAQVAENVLRAQPGLSRAETRAEVERMLSVVGLDPKRVADHYPHELSGGMAQRVMIAMALSSSPKLLIADEPSSALDVTIQAQILNLLNELVRTFNYSALLITHDMGVAAEFCDRIAVMYAGNTVEYASTLDLFAKPLHPYSCGLFKAIPKIGQTGELSAIPGEVPDLVNPPSGCRFHPRCAHATERCSRETPKLLPASEGHFVACHLYTRES